MRRLKFWVSIFISLFVYLQFFLLSTGIFVFYFLEKPEVQVFINNTFLDKFGLKIKLDEFSSHIFSQKAIEVKNIDVSIKNRFKVLVKRLELKISFKKGLTINVNKPSVCIKPLARKDSYKEHINIQDLLKGLLFIRRISVVDGILKWKTDIRIIWLRWNRKNKTLKGIISLGGNRFLMHLEFKDNIFLTVKNKSFRFSHFIRDYKNVPFKVIKEYPSVLDMTLVLPYDLAFLFIKGSLNVNYLRLVREREHMEIHKLSLSFTNIKTKSLNILKAQLNCEKPFIRMSPGYVLILNNRIFFDSLFHDMSYGVLKKIWFWAGERRVYKKFFNIVRQVKIKRLDISYVGKRSSVKDMLKGVVIGGSIYKSLVEVPGLNGIRCRNLSGRLIYTKRKLELMGVRGNILSLKVDSLKGYILFKKQADFEITFRFNSIFSDIDLIIDKNFRNISQKLHKNFKKINGLLSGWMCLSRINKKYNIGIKLNSCSLMLSYNKFPGLVRIFCKNVDFSYKKYLRIGEFVVSRDLSRAEGSLYVKLGDKNFSDFKLKIRKANLNLDKLKHLVHFNFMSLIESLKGNLIVNSVDLVGNLKNFKLTSFYSDLSSKTLVIKLKGIKEPIKLKINSIKLDNFTAKINNVFLYVLDSHFILNGVIKDFLKSKRYYSIKLSGESNKRFLKFLFSKFRISKTLLLRPFKIKTLNIDYSSHIKLEGVLHFRDNVFINMKYYDKILSIGINNLASFYISYKDINSTFIKFNGEITKSITDYIFEKNRFVLGCIKGNIKLKLKLNPFYIFDSYGNLSVRRINLIVKKQYFNFNKIEIRANKQKLFVIGRLLINRRSDFNVTKGLIDFRRGRCSFNVKSDVIKYKDIAALAGRQKKKSSFKLLKPLVGKIHIKVNKFLFKGHTLSACKAEIDIKKRGMFVDLKNINYCLVPLNGYFDFIRKKMKLYTNEKGINFCDFFKCSAKKNFITGNMDVYLDIYSSLKMNPLKDLKGKLAVKIKKGRIFKFNILMKIFALLNTTEIFLGNVPDFEKKGMGYDNILIKADIEKDKVKIKKGIINGSSLEIFFNGTYNILTHKINFVVFVCPLKTIDKILKKIPLLNKITGGNLISIPIQVVGNYNSPVVIPLSPKAISTQILNLLKRAIKMPLTIFQPFEQ